MKNKLFLFAAACALAIGVGLVGCASGEGAGGAAADSPFVGEYKLNSIESADAPVENLEVQFMEDEGLVTTLSLASDGTANISLFGVESAGTWEAADATKATLTFGEDTLEAELVGEQLRLGDAAEEDGNVVEGIMVFDRADAAGASSAAAEEASSSEAA